MKKAYICIYIIIFTLSLSAVSLFSAHADEPLTLEQCLNIAHKKNPLLQSYHQQFRASKARVRQAGAFPQPEISMDYDLMPKMFSPNKSDESYIGITQALEFPGRRLLRRKIAKKESDQVQCDLEQFKKELAYEVKKAFYQLLLEQENAGYAQENLTHALDFQGKAKLKYESGDVSKLELLRARVDAAQAKNDRRVAENRVILAKSQLNYLLARDKHQPIAIDGSLKSNRPTLDLDRLSEAALHARPDIKKLDLALKQGKLQRSQAYLSYLPDLSLGVSRHRITAEPSTWNLSLSFQIPLFFWQPARGEIAEANANIEALQHELESLRLSIELDIENAYHNAVSAANQLKFFETEVLNEANQVYHMSSISYQEGKISSIELIEARRTLLQLKQSYTETLLNYQLALAELEKQVGISIASGSPPGGLPADPYAGSAKGRRPLNPRLGGLETAPYDGNNAIQSRESFGKLENEKKNQG